MFAKLAGHFFATFPQLEGLRFTHRWAGVIDTCSRFCQFWGTALDGRVSYVLGYTGLGVAASRFGARVALDLVARSSHRTDAARLRAQQAAAVPAGAAAFPMIETTRRSTEHAELHGGRREPVAALAGPLRPRLRLVGHGRALLASARPRRRGAGRE